MIKITVGIVIALMLLAHSIAQNLFTEYIKSYVLKNKKFVIVGLLIILLITSPFSDGLVSMDNILLYLSTNDPTPSCGYWTDPLDIRIPNGYESCNLMVDLHAENIINYRLNVIQRNFAVNR